MSAQAQPNPMQAQLDRIEADAKEFRSLLANNLPLLRNVSDRQIARAEGFALRNSMKRQFGELAQGVSAMKAAKAARRKNPHGR